MHVEDRWVRKDRTKKPEHGTGLRWRAVWHDPDGKRHTRAFRIKDAAEAHLTKVDHQQRSGDYVPEDLARALLADYWPRLERLKTGRAPKTQQQYANAWHTHLQPHWGHHQARAVRGPAFAEWLEGLELSASGRTKVKQTMAALLDLAVADRVIPNNPVDKVRVRADPPRHHIYLTPTQVRALLEHLTPHYRLLTETLVATGIRIGEAAELRVKDLDLERGRIQVARGWADGEVSAPKSRRTRSVPVPAALLAQLAAAVEGKGRDELVLTGPNGARIDRRNYMRRHLEPAAARAGLPEGFRTHDLRHTFASLAISAGANVKVVQNAMGHASADITLRVYSGLFDTDLDQIATRLGEILGDLSAPAQHLTGERTPSH